MEIEIIPDIEDAAEEMLKKLDRISDMLEVLIHSHARRLTLEQEYGRSFKKYDIAGKDDELCIHDIPLSEECDGCAAMEAAEERKNERK